MGGVVSDIGNAVVSALDDLSEALVGGGGGGGAAAPADTSSQVKGEAQGEMTEGVTEPRPELMTSEDLKNAGYKLVTTTGFDEWGSYEIPAWIDPKGNSVPFSVYQIKQNDAKYQAKVRAAEEKAGNFRYVPYGGDEESGSAPTGYLKVPNAPANYTRPQEVTQSAVFQDVNPFSFGQLEKIYDSINSGAYAVTPDKSELLTPYGNFRLLSIGNNLYDIPIGGSSGSYRVAIGVTDDNKAVFDKNFIDKGAVRYVGGGGGGGFFDDLVAPLVGIASIAIPQLALLNAAIQFSQGNDLGGVISLAGGIGAIPGVDPSVAQTSRALGTGLQTGQAISQGNLAGTLQGGLNLYGMSGGQVPVELKQGINTYALADALEKEQYGKALSAAGYMSDNKSLVDVGRVATIAQNAMNRPGGIPTLRYSTPSTGATGTRIEEPPQSVVPSVVPSTGVTGSGGISKSVSTPYIAPSSSVTGGGVLSLSSIAPYLASSSQSGYSSSVIPSLKTGIVSPYQVAKGLPYS